jgi:predicted nicotinamide N-methyase
VLRHTVPRPVPLVPEILLLQADGDVFALWERAGQLPYWAYPWPGGQALARYLLDHPDAVHDRQVLDLAAGSGLVAVAAALAGAAGVTAADVDPLAHAATLLNAAANAVQVRLAQGDLLAAPGAAPAGPGWDVVLVGDASYEPALAAGIRAFCTVAAAAGALVLIGDPGRDYLQPQGLRALARYQVPTPHGLERAAVTPATVWQLLPPG